MIPIPVLLLLVNSLLAHPIRGIVRTIAFGNGDTSEAIVQRNYFVPRISNDIDHCRQERLASRHNLEHLVMIVMREHDVRSSSGQAKVSTVVLRRWKGGIMHGRPNLLEHPFRPLFRSPILNVQVPHDHLVVPLDQLRVFLDGVSPPRRSEILHFITPGDALNFLVTGFHIVQSKFLVVHPMIRHNVSTDTSLLTAVAHHHSPYQSLELLRQSRPSYELRTNHEECRRRRVLLVEYVHDARGVGEWSIVEG
mmetsp:Transcript_41103/g.124174  ORF Transcript_41103/g.124174 Transcript_41103/m.124174 type:complete len:251 (+) Transcript_41103:333-1085(+)